MSKKIVFSICLLLLSALVLLLSQTSLAEEKNLVSQNRDKVSLSQVAVPRDICARGAATTGILDDEIGLNSPAATQEEPELEATWEGVPRWMSGISHSGGETFFGSMGKGKYFFTGGSSSISDTDYVPVELRFSTSESTLCQTFRRPGYTAAGVGVFPGTAWDVSDTANPRQLNICLVEWDDGVGPNPAPDSIWNPDTTGAPTYGKREYVFVMKSSYDGTGTTYASDNLFNDTLDALYAWWPRVEPGHTLLEALPAEIDITPYDIKNARALPDTGQLVLTWNYWESDPDRFRVYSATVSPATTLIDSVSGSARSYTHSGLTNGTTYYYRIEAVNSSDTRVGISREFSAYPQKMGSSLNLVGYWNERTSYGGIWGYTDSTNGKEYALICSRPQGVSIIDINVDPPVEVGFLPSITPNRDAKEVQVYKNYAITVKESEPLQVWDISDVTSPVQVATIQPDGGSGAHTCLVDGNYVYVVGNHGAGGLEIFDISNPLTPTEVGGFQPFYYHDADIHGNKYYGCGIYGDGIDILDITNKTAPSRIDLFNYANSGPHNIELTPDGNYAFVGDEIGAAGNWTRTFDVSDPNNVIQVGEIIVDSQAIVHNCYLKSYAGTDYLHIAHYTEGVRVWDVSDPTNPSEVAYYDTYQPSGYGYYGNWTAYPMPNSNKIIASDMQTGLYVLKLDSTLVPNCVAKPGDASGNGFLGLEDLIAIANYVFSKPGCSPLPLCWLSNLLCRGDWEANGSAGLTDVIRAANYIFNKPGGPWGPIASGTCCLAVP